MLTQDFCYAGEEIKDVSRMTIVLDGRQGNVKSLPPAIGAVNTRCLIEGGCDACQGSKVDDGAPANLHPNAGNDINRYEIIGLRQ